MSAQNFARRTIRPVAMPTPIGFSHIPAQLRVVPFGPRLIRFPGRSSKSLITRSVAKRIKSTTTSTVTATVSTALCYDG
ncbi:hypothetical protein BASA50_008947 [Batrachochytrium salamandrivorans]|uniref:Uncharacterized protein n=1 Tax=Batrachochytrium salamandrivorans TaxID=1357716 RepID=A0ABQ8F2F7_9FUNG|nr:hypothetical protein BASA60_009959 [Batrachochytrium salamandrivorans]KAH6565300.1 hypothetical protein BASA62_007362 [Batrachochytrium salamandrivorans]KAH6590947.1 hypothetical protein BASA50_008947 [Batrachochytrium salamandrivorans]KAH6601867.1 hypothetical protein BASA61_001667 [Batrachochytrium salamandrivorans]KAH9268546.1 hypothetical protein BASA84_000151 [Batrachochytrium salamandrivorans]